MLVAIRSFRLIAIPVMAFVILLGSLLVPRPVSAQGGGSIIGTVADQTQAVLPGVTVTVSGPALMGTRTDVTDEEGKYRLPALPPGSDYVIVFELPGFSTVKRDGIRLDVGFTATINTTMNPAGVVETLTVSGSSPVVDITTSRVATHLDSEQITRTLVGSRDYAAVMSQMPGVLNQRVDVAGANATTMQSYRAYGLNGGRGEIEGINSSQFGSGGLVGYSDMESFDDMAVNVVGNSAETNVPGAYVNVVSKSGGNTYHGQYYVDYQSDKFGAHNIDDALIARGLVGSNVVAVRDLDTFKTFRDASANLGGFILKDKLWWFGAVRNTLQSRAYPVLIDAIATTKIPVYTGKLTYNMTPKQKVTAYVTHANKIFPNYGVGSQIVTADALIDEQYPNYVYAFSYEALLGRTAIVTLRAGHWGDYGDYKGKGQNQRYSDTGANRLYGTIPIRIDQRDRPQVNGSLALFKDGWAGSHSFKFGGEFQHEQQKYTTAVVNNLILYLNNNVPTFAEVYLSPNFTRVVGRDTGAYANDSWKLSKRLTVNLGLRFDRYRNYVPKQLGPQGHQFPQIEGPLWNNWGPRAGFVYSLTEDGKTLLKASYSKYWENPGFTLSSLFNPNPNNNFTRYNWIDPNPKYNAQGLPIYEGPQQLGSIVSISGARADFQPSVTPAPDLENQYTPQVSAYFEREVAANFGIRTGFVWNGIRNQRAVANINQPFAAFNQSVTGANPGPDGKVGTADDGPSVTAYNLDPSYLALPVVQQIQNVVVRDTDYYTWEITATKRQLNHWSLLASFSNLWSREGQTILTPNDLIHTTNGRDVFSEWQIRLASTLILTKGIEITPMYRGQAGRPFAPTFQTRLNYNSGVTIKAGLRGDYATDIVHVFDVRAQKVFRFGEKGMNIRGFVDLYNIFNTNAVQEETTSYGSNYLRPSLISGPRIARVGIRFEF
jgi:hypothetical protein